MKNKLTFYFSYFVSLVLIVAVMIGCSSRYRLEFSVITDTFSATQKAELNKFYKKAMLNNPFREEKIIPGNKNVAVLDMSLRGKKLSSSTEEFLSFDELVKLRIYLQFNKKLSPGVAELKDNAFIALLENYQLDKDDKIFIPKSGQLSLDSLAGDHIFVTVNGSFYNKKEQKIKLNGRVKIRIKD